MVQRKWLAQIKNNLNIVDYTTLIYSATTLIWILIFYNQIQTPVAKILIRISIVGLIILIIKFDISKNNRISNFIRYFYPIIFLSYWYGETADFNSVLFTPFDDFLYRIDEYIFGYQPSLLFSENFSSKIFSEVINFGYFSYYFLNIITFLIIFFYNNKDLKRAVFIITSSFFIYYWIFILFPVVGPQFWFPESLRYVPDGYIFREGVKLVQLIGEKPTGAFPSSHVGMTIIFLILTLQTSKKAFLFMLPISIILCFATVYIKAHYFIDVVFGIISGFFFFYISNFLYSKYENRLNL